MKNKITKSPTVGDYYSNGSDIILIRRYNRYDNYMVVHSFLKNKSIEITRFDFFENYHKHDGDISTIIEKKAMGNLLFGFVVGIASMLILYLLK